MSQIKGSAKTGGRVKGSRDLKPRKGAGQIQALKAALKEELMGKCAAEVPVFKRVNIEELARSYAPAVLRSMFQVCMTSPSHPARVAAANVILQRGYGMPSQAVQITGAIALKMMSDNELEALAKKMSTLVPVIEGPVYESAGELGEVEPEPA